MKKKVIEEIAVKFADQINLIIICKLLTIHMKIINLSHSYSLY